MTPEEAASATRMKRPTAAFHLDRLVGDGLLDASFARLSGRRGPGAGRTAKVYRRARQQIEVSLPPRRYELAGHILATALTRAPHTPGGAGEAVAVAAEQAGQRLAGGAAGPGDPPPTGAVGLARALAEAGFEPRPEAGGLVRLANCPFHELARHNREVVCGMNLHLVRGLLSALGFPGTAELAPAAGQCCVLIRPHAGPGQAARA